MRANVVDGDRDPVSADRGDFLQQRLWMREHVAFGEFEGQLKSFARFGQRRMLG
jgi:hypothetical protein